MIYICTGILVSPNFKKLAWIAMNLKIILNIPDLNMLEDK
jgi:hypothetical protein